jgi:ribosomal protein S18 acetylase RimI-like enzyme
MLTQPEKTLLSESPNLPGLTFRGFAGESDYPKMLAVIEASKHADKIERSETVDDLRRNYDHLTHCDPYTDMLFAEMNGEVIGYNRVWWEKQEDGVLLYNVIGFLHPDWRRKRIGTTMLQHAEARLRQIAARHESPGQKFFQFWANDSEQALLGLIESQGYQPARYFFEMTRNINEPLPEAPLPPGLEIRPVTAAHYRPIFEASNEAFRDHWGFVERTFEEDFPSWMEDPDFNPALWKVAWDGDQVAGMVQNFVNAGENNEYNRKRGYTEGISVRRPWRKLGLARSLLVQSITMFKEMGMTETALGVDAENLSGALRLYLSVGYKEVKRSMNYRKPLDYVERKTR